MLSCGGILTPGRLDTALRTMFPKLCGMEKRTGQAAPRTLGTKPSNVPSTKITNCVKTKFMSFWKWNRKQCRGRRAC